MDSEALADVDAAATDLLILYAHMGIRALLIAQVDGVIVVRCQAREDVLPLCRAVVKEHEAPEGRSIN